MNTNKIQRALLAILIFAGAVLVSACKPQSTAEQQDKINIVVASYPEYDWLCQIIGKDSEEFSVKLLMDGGVDLHSYEPNIQDIAAITKADLFIYNGGVSYAWVNRILKLESKKERQVINLLEELDRKGKLLAGEACHHCHDEHCDHDHAHEHHHEDEIKDEHIWLSLRNAIILTEIIEDAVSTLSPEQAERFESQKQSYIAKLQDLDSRYSQSVQQASRDTIIIADRFPFIYLMNDYGIKHHAAFEGCSAESEASFETVTELSQDLKQLQPPVVLILNGGMKKLAETIIKNSSHTQCQIMEMNDLHSVSKESRDKGSDYLSIMEANLKVIQAALAP